MIDLLIVNFVQGLKLMETIGPVHRLNEPIEEDYLEANQKTLWSILYFQVRL